ncbi:MAG: indolepyruvate ferredoxin oxidoreductase [Phycisphaeraceae bacterium]|nr:indolepyruvate ferredoxin oxidoreductase [Phycisphaeraceae bacterium]|tara:strand:+ start:1115 stop:4921 length:3807 start_codon:yes stop_codon:yes gene_type:complete
MKTPPRFCKEAGREVFTGNELLVKGALETEGGIHLLTGYPGSPIAGFFDAITSIGPLLKEKGIVGHTANNEALSVAMANGAQMAGCRAMVAVKSVGLHVASDALALGVLAGTRSKSGALIVCGDDPWSDSTQVPADSRFLAEHVRLPMVEPSCSQEVKDWVNLSFKLGAAGNIYIGYMMTVALADGGGTVECFANHTPELNQNQKRSLSYANDIEPMLDQTVLLPPRTGTREIALTKSFQALKVAARELSINRILNQPQKGERAPLGFIASGVSFAYLSHALTEMRLAERLPVLKLGMSYPVDEEIVTKFALQCDHIVVVEERRSFIERQVVEILNPQKQTGWISTKIYGKKFPGSFEPIPSTRGLNPSILIERLTPLIMDHSALPIELTGQDRLRLGKQLQQIKQTGEYKVDIPNRTPTFCPGCPHRDSSSVLLELRNDLRDPTYMLDTHKRKPVDLVCHGDTGCYTMYMFEPTKPLMHNYSGMGLGGGTGSGVDPFIENKQIVFMGDGTFFHSGQIAISHSLAAGQDITYIILDNKTTAMTGHQTNPGNECDLTGNPMLAQDIERTIRGMIPKQLAKDARLVRINPADRQRYRQLLEQTILADGVKIVIADKECGITHYRRQRIQENQIQRQLGYLPRKTYMNVASEVCEHCLECTTQTGCPGLMNISTDYGPKIQTDMSWCVNDGACQRIHIGCPSFESVTVTRKEPQRQGDEKVDLSNLPAPPRPIHADQETWRCYLAGVGGMGIGTCTALLVTAGLKMGYAVQYLDKKGLAIRNGGVFSQLVFKRKNQLDTVDKSQNANVDATARAANTILDNTTPLIPYGQADLLLGIDLLEALRGIDPALPHRVASQRTAAIINTAKTPTILSLMGRDRFDPNDLDATLRKYTHPEHYYGFNVGDLCERMLDSKLYTNIMILGMAYQKGFLPLTLESIEKAIELTIKHDLQRNLRAFNIGRLIVVRPDLFTVHLKHEYESSRQCLRHKLNTIRASHRGKRGNRLAKQFRILMKQTFRATRGSCVPDPLIRDVVIRAYDCLTWGGMAYAKRYCHRLVDVFEKDDAQRDYRITRAAVWNLAKVMLIKDEFYVAALLTSPEKYKRDRKRFNVNHNNGDRIIYRHHNRPEIILFGHKFGFEWKSRDWQLRLMAAARPLRDLVYHILPHKGEVAFRDWYEDLVDRFEYVGNKDYERWLAILSTPETVTGYREIRHPKMEAARQRGDELLSMNPKEYNSSQPTSKPEIHIVNLPVLTPSTTKMPVDHGKSTSQPTGH